MQAFILLSTHKYPPTLIQNPFILADLNVLKGGYLGMGTTHNAPIARAATKTGSNDAMIRTWLSAAMIARKRNARKRKKAVVPECKPCAKLSARNAGLPGEFNSQ